MKECGMRYGGRLSIIPSPFSWIRTHFNFSAASLINIFSLNIGPQEGNTESERKRRGRKKEREGIFCRSREKKLLRNKKKGESQVRIKRKRERVEKEVETRTSTHSLTLPSTQPPLCPISSSKHSHLCRASCQAGEKVRTRGKCLKSPLLVSTAFSLPKQKVAFYTFLKSLQNVANIMLQASERGLLRSSSNQVSSGI